MIHIIIIILMYTIGTGQVGWRIFQDILLSGWRWRLAMGKKEDMKIDNGKMFEASLHSEWNRWPAKTHW